MAAKRRTAAKRQDTTARKAAKAQAAPAGLAPRASASAAPARRKRAKPGAKGGGRFFHIEVRRRGEFVAFRVQDVGGQDGIERLAGLRADGSWDTATWLIGKQHAHLEGDRLVPDSAAAKKVLRSLGSVPRHVVGDRFAAKPRRKIPQSEKPTPAMRRAQQANIKKAQAALRKRRRAGFGRTAG